jgi:hypothetical protein
MSCGSPDGLATVAPEHPIWIDFAKGMASFVSLTAKMPASLVGRANAAVHQYVRRS